MEQDNRSQVDGAGNVRVERMVRPMTCDEQIALWVNGESVHNSAREECCPDFSCCQPSLLWPKEMREMFRDCPERRNAMLFGALGAAIAEMGKSDEVYLAGKPTSDWVA